MKKTYLGMDLGGTKLLVGEMDKSGRVLWERKYDTGVLTQKNAFALMKRAMDNVLAERGLEGVAGLGIGIPGKVDHARGIWHELDITRQDPIDLAGEMERLYGLPCRIDNDVRSAARAEYRFGIGREADSFVLLNIGTGIASAFMLHGSLLEGAHFEAGEIGHTASGVDCRIPCYCGRDDCVESVSSGGGMADRARALFPRYPDTALVLPEKPDNPKAADIFALWGRDPLCTLLTDDAVRGAASLIMNTVRFYDPACVVLAGGVGMNPFFFERVMDLIPPAIRGYVPMGIRQSALKPGAVGLMGACCNVMAAEAAPGGQSDHGSKCPRKNEKNA